MTPGPGGQLSRENTEGLQTCSSMLLRQGVRGRRPALVNCYGGGNFPAAWGWITAGQPPPSAHVR